MAATLLDNVRARLTVDVDSMDPDVAARHSRTDKIFRDMTSNQAIVYSEAVRTERSDVVRAACLATKASGLDAAHQVADALDLLVRTSVSFAAPRSR